VLSLGIYLKIGGRSEWTVFGAGFRIPLPYLAATHLPLFGNLRSTGRFGIVAIVAAAPLAAAGLRAVLERVPLRRRTSVLIAAALLIGAERIVVPLPLQDATVPGIYGEMSRDPGNFAILEVPFGLRDGSWIIGREDSRMELNQTVHRHPILSGCVSRMREETPRWFGEQPVTRSLIKFESSGALAPDDIEYDREGAARWVRETGVKYILVHTELSRSGRDYRALARYLAGVTSPADVRETSEGIIVLRLY